MKTSCAYNRCLQIFFIIVQILFIVSVIINTFHYTETLYIVQSLRLYCFIGKMCTLLHLSAPESVGCIYSLLHEVDIVWTELHKL